MSTYDGEGGRSNTAVQVGMILAELQGSAAEPPDWEQTGEVDFLYRAGSILVRDDDLDEVRRLLPGGAALPVIPGLTRYLPNLPTLEALRLLEGASDRLLGTPDHVLYSVPRTYCAATEPEQTASMNPDPPVARDDCDGRGTRVSVVDTGWLPQAAVEHSWLAGVTGDEEVALDGAGNLRSYAGHGTFAAGVVRAAAPAAHVEIEGVLPYSAAWFEADIVAQLSEALAKNPDVISLQAGTTTRNDADLLSFDVLFREHRPLGHSVLVAAAGNDGSDREFWPAAFPWALAVGALTKDGTARASWSNFGSWVDIYARGEDHVNAFATGRFVTVEMPAGQVRNYQGMAQWSGTSFASPYVAGCIAAYMSGAGVTAQQARDVLMARATSHPVAGAGPALTRDMVCGGDDDGDDCGFFRRLLRRLVALLESRRHRH